MRGPLSRACRGLVERRAASLGAMVDVLHEVAKVFNKVDYAAVGALVAVLCLTLFTPFFKAAQGRSVMSHPAPPPFKKHSFVLRNGAKTCRSEL